MDDRMHHNEYCATVLFSPWPLSSSAYPMITCTNPIDFNFPLVARRLQASTHATHTCMYTYYSHTHTHTHTHTHWSHMHTLSLTGRWKSTQLEELLSSHHCWCQEASLLCRRHHVAWSGRRDLLSESGHVHWSTAVRKGVQWRWALWLAKSHTLKRLNGSSVLWMIYAEDRGLGLRAL